MMSSNALSRTPAITQDNQRIVRAPLGDVVTSKIALAFADAITLDDTLADMAPTAVEWRATPSVQNIFAAICADMVTEGTRISCCGVPAQNWMLASGMSMTNVMRVHLGKIFSANVAGMSAEDIAATMKKGQMQIVALHVEDANGWNDVRQISAGAVKAEVPMLMFISAAVPAPEGVALDIIKNVEDAMHATRDAFVSVRDNGAIRLVAMDDMAGPAVEIGVMQAANMNAQSWSDALEANNVAAVNAMNAAYQSAVETF